MRLRSLFLAAFVVAIGSSFLPSSTANRSVAADTKAAAPTFADVQSILNTSCVNCHNPSKRKGGVDLQSLSSVLKNVKPGEPDQSRLYKSIAGVKGTKAMPPKKRLAASEIDTVKAWIAGGAKEK